MTGLFTVPSPAGSTFFPPHRNCWTLCLELYLAMGKEEQVEMGSDPQWHFRFMMLGRRRLVGCHPTQCFSEEESSVKGMRKTVCRC